MLAPYALLVEAILPEDTAAMLAPYALLSEISDTTYLFNVRDYGAIGDGVTDDTDALQATLSAASLGGGTVTLSHDTLLFTATVYAYGNVNIIDGALKPRMTIDSWVSLAMGAKSGDATGNYVWSGRIENVTFDCYHHRFNGNIINVFRGDNYAIKNCSFINPYHTSIKGVNNGAYASDFEGRKNVLYENNYIYVHPDSVGLNGEGMSIDEGAADYDTKNIKILNNTIIGCTDDPIAIHGECADIIIANNICKSRWGRIALRDSKNILVDGNLLTHTTDTGWYVDVTDEYGGSDVIENVTISNNMIVTPTKGGDDASYMVRVRGGNNIRIINNDIINRFPDNTTEADTIIRAIEIVDDTYPCTNITITGNRIYKGYIHQYSNTDTAYVIRDNIVTYGYIYNRNVGDVGDNIIIPHPGYDYIYRETTIAILETKIAEFYITLPDDDLDFDMYMSNGLASFSIPHDLEITSYKISFGELFTSGWIGLESKINGGLKMTLSADNANQYFFKQPTVGTAQSIVSEGDILTIDGDTNPSGGTLGKVLVVEVYGAYTGTRY